jgi:Kelch motif
MLDYYDIDLDVWVTGLPDAPRPRDHCGGAYISATNKICVAGGRLGGTPNWPVVPETDCFDLTTQTWSTEASIPTPRAGSSYGTTCDGKLMIAGGEGSNQAYNNVDVFDGTAWTTIDNMVRPRHGSGLAIDCQCNQIYIASGSGSAGASPELVSVETYFPSGTDTVCPL